MPAPVLPLPPVTVSANGTTVPFAFNNGYPNLVWSIWPDNNFPGPSGAPPTSVGLGQPSDGSSSTLLDAREHPFWRIEMLQRVMNLTTVRTHQYAVWITVGFFEVKRRGNVGMIASADPRLAFDVLGPEIGLGGDQAPPLSRLLPGRPTQARWLRPDELTGPWHSAVVYRQNLQ